MIDSTSIEAPLTPTLCLTGGGHASVVIDAASLQGEVTITAILDDDDSALGATRFGVPVIATLEHLDAMPEQGFHQFILGLGGTDAPGGARRRESLFERAWQAGLEPVTVIHPRSIIAGGVSIGGGTVVLAGAILNPRSRVGVNAIVNSGAILEHDVRIGDHAHVAPGAILCGGVHVGCRAHVGAGAVIRQGITIGEDAVVAAGAVVVRDVAAGELVMGTPASRVIPLAGEAA